MLDYVVVAGGFLGLNLKSLFNFDSLGELGLIAFSGIALIGLGASIKGFWGAGIAFSIGIFLLLAYKGLLPL